MTDRYRSPGLRRSPSGRNDSGRELLAGHETPGGLREAFVTEHLRRVFLQIYRMAGQQNSS